MRPTTVRASEDRALVARVVAEQPLAGVSAGSALLATENGLLAVHDDAFRVSLIALPSLAITPLVLSGAGESLPKPEKPDFESAVASPDGAIYLVGSGSTDNRRTVARIDLRAAAVTLEARPDLYEHVARTLAGGQPNVEGAVIAGGRLRLFHRGAGGASSAVVDLPIEALRGAVRAPLGVLELDLGSLDGVRLGFTDAASVSRGRVLFAAAAEDAPDAIADGPVRGSVLGVLDRATARWTRLVDAAGRAWSAKVEGLAVDADERGAWILTDPDDPNRPTLLGRVELEGFA